MFNAMEKNKITRYCINNVAEFLPDKNRLINCVTGDENTLYSTASRCLHVLITNVGKVVTHTSLYEAGWERQGKEVTPNTLYQTISELRKQLNNAGFKNNIIQTLPRQGWSISNDVVVTEITESISSKNTQVLPSAQDKSIRQLCKNFVKYLTQ